MKLTLMTHAQLDGIGFHAVKNSTVKTQYASEPSNHDLMDVIFLVFIFVCLIWDV
jgi:hypothetical protein